ncbi:hypothetical protein EIP86_011123 [Pleurotus ostreatoroseus]|nr:hypothetical protein EIP86_011123 [Pleurotus ostreatoroseus]
MNVPKIIGMFAVYLDKDWTRQVLTDDLRKDYGDPDEWSKLFPPFLSPVNIQGALCKALADYASAVTLPLDASHLQDLARVSSSLREACRGPRIEAKDEMKAARADLRTLVIAVMSHLSAARKKNGSLIRARTIEGGRRTDWPTPEPETDRSSTPFGDRGHLKRFGAIDEMSLEAAREELTKLNVKLNVELEAMAEAKRFYSMHKLPGNPDLPLILARRVDAILGRPQRLSLPRRHSYVY